MVKPVPVRLKAEIPIEYGVQLKTERAMALSENLS